MNLTDSVLATTIKEQANVFCAHRFQNQDSHFSWSSASASPLKLDFNPRERIFRLEADAWGRTPVFYAFANGIAWVSSHAELLASLLPSVSKNPDAQGLLAQKGFLSPGITPWSEIQKLPPDSGLCFETINDETRLHIYPLHQLKKNWFTESWSEAWQEEALHLLRNSVIEIVSGGITSMAVSGGCDSRLILALMPTEIRKTLRPYTKVNPALPSTEDNDAVIAQKVLQHLGIDHQLILKPKNYKAFLASEDIPEVVLSGLYGGEFLGGTLYDMWKDDFLRQFDYGPEKLKELFLTSINSSRTLIHDKFELGWACPYSNLYHARTPFLDPKFLNHLISLKFSDFKDYQVYNKIWQRPEFQWAAKIPFQSPLKDFFSYPSLFNGKDPKDQENLERDTLQIDHIVQQNLNFYWNRFYQKEAWYL